MNNLTVFDNRYHQMIEFMTDAVLIQQDKKIIYANKAAFDLLGANNEQELYPHSVYDFFPLEYEKIIHQHIKNQDYGTSKLSFEGKIINLNKELVDIETTINFIIHKEKVDFYIQMRNVTEEKRFLLYLDIQYEIARILSESENLYISTEKILKTICERLGWDCGIIWAVDKNSNILRCIKAWQLPQLKNLSFKQESQYITIDPGVGLTGQAWKEQKAIWKLNILLESHFLRKASATQLGLNTAVAFPIIYETMVLGVVEFFSRNNIEPNNNSLLWFESIGNQLGAYLMKKHLENQILYLSEHDILTGLSERTLLEQYLNTTLETAQKNNTQLAILFLDLDHFKNVTDSVGYQMGELLLNYVFEELKLSLRASDTINRTHEDEFIITITNIHNKDEIIELVTRLQKKLSEKITLNNKDFFITASIGISIYPQDGTTAQSLIKGADTAMYSAKEKGRNNYQFCTHTMITMVENQGVLINDLDKALKNNEFLLYYQPKIDVATRKTVGMEALIRWQISGGIILPRNFFHAAENSKLIHPIGEWVIKSACLQNKAWLNLGFNNITTSINLSVRNLNNHLLKIIEQTVYELNISPSTLEIELTESVLMENVENNIIILRYLKKMGLQIAIDDFGTGYSSLNYLKRFPIDTIKVDQSFVRDIATDQDDAAIVNAIIVMAHSLGIKVVAEGVETKEQLKFLCEHGCDEIQGFYFSQPLSANAATTFLQNEEISWKFD